MVPTMSTFKSRWRCVTTYVFLFVFRNSSAQNPTGSCTLGVCDNGTCKYSTGGCVNCASPNVCVNQICTPPATATCSPPCSASQTCSNTGVCVTAPCSASVPTGSCPLPTQVVGYSNTTLHPLVCVTRPSLLGMPSGPLSNYSVWRLLSCLPNWTVHWLTYDTRAQTHTHTHAHTTHARTLFAHLAASSLLMISGLCVQVGRLCVVEHCLLCRRSERRLRCRTSCLASSLLFSANVFW
jgi:hypothetical protein